MVKFAVFVLLAFAAVATAKPSWGYGGAVVSRNHHVSSSHVISPHLGWGYGMLGYPGSVVGHSVSSSSHSSHIVPHYGLGLGGLGYKGLGYYPGGIGVGYGLGLLG